MVPYCHPFKEIVENNFINAELTVSDEIFRLLMHLAGECVALWSTLPSFR
jgi:hypothetical protein